MGDLVRVDVGKAVTGVYQQLAGRALARPDSTADAENLEGCLSIIGGGRHAAEARPAVSISVSRVLLLL